MYIAVFNEDFIINPSISALTLLPVLFSSMALQMGYYGHIWIYWVLIGLLAISLLRRRYFIAALLLGLALISRQTAFFVIGMVGAVMLRRLNITQVRIYSVIIVLIFLAVMLPATSGSGPSMLEFYFTGLQKGAIITHGQTLNPADQIALSGYFVWSGYRDYMMWLQILVAGMFCVAFLFLGVRLELTQMLVIIGVAYLFIIALSPFLHRYFYGPALIFVSVGLSELLRVKLREKSGDVLF
ncbi:MAG: hypothetical protein MZV65_22490 [Chromatiales bacterium]|nr:hypothetical protein [Chromatiales bacterium]